MCNVYYILLFFPFFYLSSSLQCRDPNNNPVDWYVIYKLPKQASHKNEFVKEGLGFVYMTSENYKEWTLSAVDINDTNSMVAHTLNGLYSNKKSQENLYILYNDQPPYGGKSDENKGHTKGIVMANKNEGFWLIHSVPHFPYSVQQYVYPKTGVHYGQSFLCISLGLSDLDSVGIQLQYNEPHIFAQNIPETLGNSFPELLKAARNETIKAAPWFNVINITSPNDTRFVSFAKSGKFGKDLYADLVNFHIKSSLYVESWPNEPNRLPSECETSYKVNNILAISISEASISFHSTVDHSKWAVSAPAHNLKWICIGDINRAEKQTKRGGGTTCLQNGQLGSVYQNMVSSVQQCDDTYFYEIFRVSLLV